MKNLIFFFALIFCFISCENKEKYNGKWSLDVYKSTDEFIPSPTNFQIKNDSINFNYWGFNHSHKYPIKIENNTLLFNNWAIKANIIADTLSLKHHAYIKYNNDSVLKSWWIEPITNINLPKIKKPFYVNTKDKDPSYQILFGRRLENNKFSLQLNDKHTEIHDLPAFITAERSHSRIELTPFYKAMLYIYHITPMVFVEDIFYNLTIVNQLKVAFVNDINLQYNDSIGIHYEYENLIKRLPPRMENDHYNTNTSKDKISLPPPPPFNYPFFGDFNPVSKFILLKKDKIYYNDSIINPSELKTLVTPWIESNNAMFSPYSLESTYKSFLEMNAIINSAYNDVRENQALTKFNKKLNDLTREELTEIKLQTPMLHVWSYSIPHYNSIVEKESSFFGLKAKSIN